MDTGKQDAVDGCAEVARKPKIRRRQYAVDDPRVIALDRARLAMVLSGTKPKSRIRSARSWGSKQLAERLGIQRQAIVGWRIVPPGRVRDVERATGISRHELRPDIFGPPSEA